MLIFFIITTLMFGGISIFLSKELIKKFGFWKRFEGAHQYKTSWKYSGNLKPGMYKLQISGKESFSTLIGFDFSILGFKDIGYDVFGYMESTEYGCIECLVYLGGGGVDFIFLLNKKQNIDFSCSSWDGSPTEYIFEPHWWQRIGIFG